MAFDPSALSGLPGFPVEDDSFIRAGMASKCPPNVALFPRCSVPTSGSQPEVQNGELSNFHLLPNRSTTPTSQRENKVTLNSFDGNTKTPYEHTLSSFAHLTSTFSDFDTGPDDSGLDSFGPEVKQSESSESQACYGNDNVVRELRPDYVRWFFKYDVDRLWTPFTGYDSFRIETRYRDALEKDELVEVDKESSSPEENFELRRGSTGFGFSPKLEKPLKEGKRWFRSWRPAKSDSFLFRKDKESKDETNIPFTIPPTAPGSPSRHHYVQFQPGTRAGSGPTSRTSSHANSPVNENIIVVRGGLYEVDLDLGTCTATYWPGDSCIITRGTWFYDGTWQPMSVEFAERLEEEHLGTFAGMSVTSYSSSTESPTKKNRPVVHRVSFPDFHVDWTSPTEVYWYSKAASYKFMRSVGQRLGFQTWGHRLCRGYCQPASVGDRPPEISHMVFVIHGIGQKMDQGRIVRNCSTFRECVSSLKERQFPHLANTRQRAEFFPVEWRSAARLDGDIVDAITPQKLLGLRQILNSTAMDIMYYTSPLYRTEIQNALQGEMNRIYANFVKRNPNFEIRGGKVSILAHSLGAVITYDIVTGYDKQWNRDYPEGISGDESSLSNEDINPEGLVINNDTSPSPSPNVPVKNIKGLLFKIEHFFCIGSPLSVFLALRFKEPHNPDIRSYVLPKSLCQHFYNVFHPSDPVAYRMEPLLNKRYMNIAPLPVQAYNATVKLKYEDMAKEPVVRDKFDIGVSIPDGPAKTLKSPPAILQDSNWGWTSLKKYWKSGEINWNQDAVDGELVNPTSTCSNGEVVVDDLSMEPEPESEMPQQEQDEPILNDLDCRMDYVLRESNLSSSYLAALTSHTSYWSSPDAAFFVLTHLYNGALDPSKL